MDKNDIAARIEAFDAANGGGVGWYQDKGAFCLYLLATEAPIARFKPTGAGDDVRIYVRGGWSPRFSGWSDYGSRFV